MNHLKKKKKKKKSPLSPPNAFQRSRPLEGINNMSTSTALISVRHSPIQRSFPVQSRPTRDESVVELETFAKVSNLSLHSFEPGPFFSFFFSQVASIFSLVFFPSLPLVQSLLYITKTNPNCTSNVSQ